MTDSHTVIYTDSIDELPDRTGINITNPNNGDDWGLVAETDNLITIRWMYSERELTLTPDKYDDLLSDSYTKTFSFDNATRDVLSYGADAILDLKHGKHPLANITAESLPETVAAVFAMKGEQGWLNWPTTDNSNGADDPDNS